jgi:hypothetical protein
MNSIGCSTFAFLCGNFAFIAVDIMARFKIWTVLDGLLNASAFVERHAV